MGNSPKIRQTKFNFFFTPNPLCRTLGLNVLIPGKNVILVAAHGVAQ